MIDLQRILSVALFLLIAGSVVCPAQSKAEGSPTFYRLLAGSTLTSENTGLNGVVTSQTSILSGTFVLTKQMSPLDWDNYNLDDIQWIIADGPTNRAIANGTGTYSVTERFGNTKELNLKLQISGRAVDLQSGAVPTDQNWPLIDIVVQGVVQNEGGTVRYSLHVIAAPELQVWHYRLFEGSSFTDDCLICDHLSIPEPMRGSFDLVLIDSNTLVSRYILRDINLTSNWAGESRKFTGTGSFQFGGEVALQQEMTLQLAVQSNGTNQFKTFTNSTSSVQKIWPIMEVNLDETEGTLAHTYRLHLLAAPLREIWFSITTNFISGSAALSNKKISNGDILSDVGGVIEHNIALMRPFGLNPDITVGIDAFTIRPGGEVEFSLNNDLMSNTTGPLHHGDLLSNHGQLVERNQDLLSPFGLMPLAPDVGLDAVQFLDDGEILFSITADAFSELKNVALHHGDLLSSKGEVKKTNRQLLSVFHPDVVDHDYGLDAAYLWPSGEIWFSTQEAINDQQLGIITDGDLLSDQGYIVFRNLELVSAFVPPEGVSNFGLDGLYLVSDASVPAPASNLLSLAVDRSNNVATLAWKGKGRVFQIEKTADLAMPFAPTSPVLPGTNWTDTGTLRSPSFYRLRQW